MWYRHRLQDNIGKPERHSWNASVTDLFVNEFQLGAQIHPGII